MAQKNSGASEQQLGRLTARPKSAPQIADKPSTVVILSVARNPLFLEGRQIADSSSLRVME
jgi:hypothetical protein